MELPSLKGNTDLGKVVKFIENGFTKYGIIFQFNPIDEKYTIRHYNSTQDSRLPGNELTILKQEEIPEKVKIDPMYEKNLNKFKNNNTIQQKFLLQPIKENKLPSLKNTVTKQNNNNNIIESILNSTHTRNKLLAPLPPKKEEKKEQEKQKERKTNRTKNKQENSKEVKNNFIKNDIKL
jgi:hypothetical protein